VEKKDGGQRPIINLKGLEDRTFQDGICCQISGLNDKAGPEGCILSSPRLSTPPSGRGFQCLPFGLSAAPRVFTKLLKPVVGFLRQNDYQFLPRSCANPTGCSENDPPSIREIARFIGKTAATMKAIPLAPLHY